MVPLMFTSLTNLVVFVVPFLLSTVIEWRKASASLVRRKNAKSQDQDRGSARFLAAMILIGMNVGFFATFLLPGMTILWHRQEVFYTGVALMVAGILFRHYAIWVLGRHFSAHVSVQVQQEIIQTGPYRFIRHPAYTGGFFMIVGVGVALTNWVSILVLAGSLMLGYIYRVSVEERMLCTTLGQPYQDYMRSTRRFIPFVL